MQAVKDMINRKMFGKKKPIPLKSKDQIDKAPSKMYEDSSYQGNPKELKKKNPKDKFYEDNTFSAPKKGGIAVGNPKKVK